jgi:hypothetical protein
MIARRYTYTEVGKRQFLPLRTPELEASLGETFDENAILADDTDAKPTLAGSI